MPAPTPITSAPIPTKRCRSRRAAARATRTIPFFLELKGQILLEGGKPAEAIAPLREAVARRARPADDRGDARPRPDRDRGPEEFRRGQAGAERPRSTATIENPFAWYQLGIIYDREGDQPRAALATAERNNLEGKPSWRWPAREMAMTGIPPGHAGLSSRPGHRHGVRDRAEEGQEVQKEHRE